MAQFDPTKYDPVADRIRQFRAAHPEGAIIVTLLSDPAQFDQVVCRAEVYLHKDDARPIGADIAAEWRGENFKAGANFTAWHENCATSAIGRALDAAGYSKAIDGRASREEMQKVARHSQPALPAPTKPAQPTNAAPLTVIEGGETAEPKTAWEKLTDRAAEFGFTSEDTRDYIFLTNELCKGIEIKGDERYLYAAGENGVAWEAAIEALKARKQKSGREAVTA